MYCLWNSSHVVFVYSSVFPIELPLSSLLSPHLPSQLFPYLRWFLKVSSQASYCWKVLIVSWFVLNKAHTLLSLPAEPSRPCFLLECIWPTCTFLFICIAYSFIPFKAPWSNVTYSWSLYHLQWSECLDPSQSKVLKTSTSMWPC